MVGEAGCGAGVVWVASSCLGAEGWGCLGVARGLGSGVFYIGKGLGGNREGSGSRWRTMKVLVEADREGGNEREFLEDTATGAANDPMLGSAN